MDEHSPRGGGRRGRKHVLVREYVRSVIVNAEPGTPAPSERDLAEQFGVARMTVRHAIDALVAQGLLERVAGRGTFVTKPLIDMQMRLSAYTEEMERRGKRRSPRPCWPAARAPAPAWPARWRSRRAPRSPTGSGCGSPTACRWRSSTSTSRSTCSRTSSTRRCPSSLYFWFAMRDLMPTWGEDSVLAGIATEEEAELLELEPGSPVLHISRRAFCRENVVEVTRSVYRADRYTLWVPVLRPEHLR